MPDREKVINGLQELHGSKETMELISDSISLLKEQEAVKPKTDDAWPSGIKTCGSCGTCLFTVGDYKPKYCSECGRRVKWNE